MKTLHEPSWTARKSRIVPPPRRTDMIEEELDHQAVLVHPRTSHMHRLNETALIVWRACDGEATTKQIAERLTDVYDVDFDGALDSVDQLMAMFAQLQLFEGQTEDLSDGK